MAEPRRGTRRAADGSEPAEAAVGAVASIPDPPAAAADEPSAVTIPARRLVAESDAFLGCPSHVAAGALAMVDPDEQLNVDIAREAVRTWLARPVEEV